MSLSSIVIPASLSKNHTSTQSKLSSFEVTENDSEQTKAPLTAQLVSVIASSATFCLRKDMIQCFRLRIKITTLFPLVSCAFVPPVFIFLYYPLLLYQQKDLSLRDTNCPPTPSLACSLRQCYPLE